MASGPQYLERPQEARTQLVSRLGALHLPVKLRILPQTPDRSADENAAHEKLSETLVEPCEIKQDKAWLRSPALGQACVCVCS